ncbi:TetR/AcrR family transcriptional regulator [Nocardia blacklockiae]|uniref:TetR/AcrR family transcriptional regulator n=1 Tax=Nocardia blacklockiae TaxID=480036 RepID=UPI001895681B|nr:TetR family transcriptional regulator [Nocardia blacklockiae]MBF6170513.1 TetR family transcriptional regulator [Nocardia blacklockiae]
MTDQTSLGLRERKKRDTRRALSDATLALAFEQGLENVVREDIAARAGVSVRTFSNYFANKYEALAYRQIERIQRTIELIRTHPGEGPIWEIVTEAVLEPFVAELGPAAAPTPAQLTEVAKLVQAPETQGVLTRTLVQDLTAALAERTHTDPKRDLYPRLLAGAVIAAYEAASENYAVCDPPVPITTLLRRALSSLAAGLPAPPS